MRFIFVIGIALVLFLVSCQSEEKQQVAVTESKPAHPWDWVPTEPASLAGKAVYLNECASCHNEGEEGAPALTNKKEWSKREAKGLTTLYDHAINGYIGVDGEMPARGGTPSLTDDQVKNAVQFILGTQK